MIRPLWDSRYLTNMGPLHKEFETALRGRLGVDRLELFVNGHLGLELALQAMHLSGEVITTPFSFASTVHAIVRNRLTPVFCDIRASDFTLDPKKIEELITEKTTAILPVHVYGNPCDVEEIDAIAKRHGLQVLYDAAHAFDVTWKGKGIGCYGDASMFSFHATKLFHSIEGGAVACQSSDLAEELYNLKNFGIRSPEHVVGVGSNAKMNEFQAAMGLCNLRHMEEVYAGRKRVVELYCQRLSGQAGLYSSCWHNKAEVGWNYGYFPLLVDEAVFGISRDALVRALQEADIYPRKYFYPLISDYACYADRFDSCATPVAQRVAQQVLTLPVYSGLEGADVKRICDAILRSRR